MLKKRGEAPCSPVIFARDGSGFEIRLWWYALEDFPGKEVLFCNGLVVRAII